MSKKEFRQNYPGAVWDQYQRDRHLATEAYIYFYKRGQCQLQIKCIYDKDNRTAPAGAARTGQI